MSSPSIAEPPLEVILVAPGVSPGGVTTDIVNLKDGLTQRGLRCSVVGATGAVVRALRAKPRAIVHVFGCLPNLATFAALASAKGFGRFLVWTPIFHPSRRQTWVGYGPLRVMQAFDTVAPYAARLTDAVIAATEAEGDYFSAIGARRVEVIPPGVPPLPEPMDETRIAEFRARLGVDDGPVVLTVARDNRRKALPFGIAVFDELRERCPDAQMLLAGPDSGHPAGRHPGVRVAGWLDAAEIQVAYALARVLFVSSMYEGLPRAVIEAWRFGLPVVATDRVALAPMINEAGGRVVEYGDVGGAADALADLLASPDVCARLGEQGRQLVRERFLLPDVVGRTEQLYRELVHR